MPVEMACGQCIGCRLERSRQWAIRCVHESSLHKRNCFITLTYNDHHLPRDGSLHKDHFQKFMKRLRKKYSHRIRYYMCGEYGEKCGTCGHNRKNCQSLGCGKFNPALGRPHFHAILFGHDFDDKEVFSQSLKNKLYISEQLMALWPFGFSTIGNLTFESAAYCARYVMKKINGRKKEDHYQGKQPEYTTMSRRPGIAKEWFDKYYEDLYPNDYMVIRGGIKCKPPQYYDRLYDIHYPDEMQRIIHKRKKAAMESEERQDPIRMYEKEMVQKIKSKQLIRPYEKEN